MTWLLATPLVLPFLTAVVAFLLRTKPSGRWISVAGNLALLVAGHRLERVAYETQSPAPQVPREHRSRGDHDARDVQAHALGHRRGTRGP